MTSSYSEGKVNDIIAKSVFLETDKVNQERVDWVTRVVKEHLRVMTGTHVLITGVTYDFLIEHIVQKIGFENYSDEITHLQLEFLDVTFFRNVLDSLIRSKVIIAYHPSDLEIRDNADIRHYLSLFLPNAIIQYDPNLLPLECKMI